MADKKISALTGATTPLAGTEVLPIVQGGATVNVSVANLTAGRAISATELTLTTGNLIVSNGKGIDFSATPNPGGMTSELLSDYEEGTWTPTDASGAGLTLTVNGSQFYTRVGRVITVSYNISYPATADVSAAIIGSLPFNSVAANQGGIIIGPSSTTVAFVNGSMNQFSIVTPAVVAVTNATLSGQNIFGSLTYAVV